MEAYKAWVRRNQQWLSSLESVANTLTWLLPERLANSEVAPEAVSTLIGLLTVLNRHIIETTPNVSPQQGTVGGQQIDIVCKQQEYIPGNFLLSIVKELDVLVEVTADYYLGNENKWTPIAMTEAIKALIRLIILHNSGFKILLDGGETQNMQDSMVNKETPMRGNSRDVAALERMDKNFPLFTSRAHLKGSNEVSRSSSLKSPEDWAKQSLVKFGEKVGGAGRPSWSQSRSFSTKPSDAFESNTWNGTNVFFATQNRGYVDKFVMAGEIIFVLRPLLYVFLIRRYGLRSWKPWLSSFFLDLAGLSFQVYIDRARSKLTLDLAGTTSCVPLSDSEKQELRRRRLLLALYLFRDPFFSKYSRPRLEYMERLFKPLPLIGFLSEKALGFLYGVQEFYSYTSGS